MYSWEPQLYDAICVNLKAVLMVIGVIVVCNTCYSYSDVAGFDSIPSTSSAQFVSQIQCE